ncbi:hypothetical protein [Moraxella marmotae]|uniref:hypothetical protein n=1 Tax=Moraxella marmotae TaxID=3344520 RepID=UPI0035F3B860
MEDEIGQIGQKYDFSIHDQFKELLVITGRCSGGVLLGDDIEIYRETRTKHYFSKNFAGINEHRFQLF